MNELQQQMNQMANQFNVPQENVEITQTNNAGVLSNQQMGVPPKKTKIGMSKDVVSTFKKKLFLAGEFVNAKVLDAVFTSYGKIVLNLYLNSTEHAGSEYKMSIKVDDVKGIQAERAYNFLKAFYTEEQIESGDCDIDLLIGKSIGFKALAPREWNGNTYQDFENFRQL